MDLSSSFPRSAYVFQPPKELHRHENPKSTQSAGYRAQRLQALHLSDQNQQAKLDAQAEGKLSEWLKVFDFPETQRKRLRTSSARENVKGKIKKRTRDVRHFPSKESLLRLVTGALIEIYET